MVCRLFQEREEYRAGFANFKLVFTSLLLSAFTECAIEEPAEMTALEFISRAVFPVQALLFLPAGDHVRVSSTLINQEKINITFNMRGNRTPTLFVAVNSLERHPQ